MHLLIYAPLLHVACQKLVRNLHDLEGVSFFENFTSMAALLDHLRKPLGTTPICILMPRDTSELSKLNQLRHLLRDMRIILILPDHRQATISEGHALRPRYVSYADGHLSDVATVVQKMVGVIEDQPVQATQ